MCRRLKWLVCCLFVLGVTGTAGAEAVLVGGDILNGNFNNLIIPSEADAQLFSNTVAWVNLGTGGDTQATRTGPAATVYDGTRNAVLAAGTAKVFALDTGHPIGKDQSFGVSYVWRDASGWADATDQVRVTLFVTDDNTITGVRTNLVEDFSGTSTANNTYEEVVREDLYTTVPADYGKILFVAVDTEDASGFSRLDNFAVTVKGFAFANNPSPADGAMLEATSTLLEWNPGDFAVSHEVYFSENFADVNDRLVAPVATVETSLSMTLVPGITYYWRVDEVNDANPDSPWKGQVWSFTLPPLSAYDPSPADGTQYVLSDATLSWKPGLGSLLHYMHFGTDPNALGDGIPQVETTFGPTAPLEAGTTYYWRVDEFDASTAVTTTGDLWSFTVVPPIDIQDESLLGHWTMDEVNAGSAVDWSGHALHGTISGAPEWIDGVAGAAVSLDGADDYFTTPAPVDVNSNTVTFTAWIKPAKVHGWAGIIFSRDTAPSVAGLNLKADNQLSYHWAANADTYGFNSTLVPLMNEWSFVALVIEPERATFYLNGTDITAENAIAHPATPLTAGIALGYDPTGTRRFGGAMDDLRLYSRSLTGAEIEQVMAAGTGPAPSPEDPAVIESFDSYNAYEAQTGTDVWDVWSDGYGGNGTGSWLGFQYPIMERAIVVGNRGQSLPVAYNNSGSFLDIEGKPVTATISEISRTFSPALDLAAGGATRLVLYIRGASANTVNTLEPTDNAYLLLTDGVNTDDIQLLASADLTTTTWKEVSIDLNTLAVDRAKVTTITLGVGSRTAPQAGGTGTIYIDEITRK